MSTRRYRTKRGFHIHSILFCLQKAPLPLFSDLFSNLILVGIAIVSEPIEDWCFEFVVEILETFSATMSQRFLRLTIENELATHEHYKLVKKPHVLHGVSSQDYSPSRFGDLPKQFHHPFFSRRIETWRGFVQKNNGRLSDQLDCN